MRWLYCLFLHEFTLCFQPIDIENALIHYHAACHQKRSDGWKAEAIKTVQNSLNSEHFFGNAFHSKLFMT